MFDELLDDNQSLEAKIETLEAENHALKQKVKSLEGEDEISICQKLDDFDKLQVVHEKLQEEHRDSQQEAKSLKQKLHAMFLGHEGGVLTPGRDVVQVVRTKERPNYADEPPLPYGRVECFTPPERREEPAAQDQGQRLIDIPIAEALPAESPEEPAAQDQERHQTDVPIAEVLPDSERARL